MPQNSHALTMCYCTQYVAGKHASGTTIFQYALSAHVQHKSALGAHLKCLKVGSRGVSIMMAPNMSTYVLHTAQQILPLHLQTHAQRQDLIQTACMCRTAIWQTGVNLNS